MEVRRVAGRQESTAALTCFVPSSTSQLEQEARNPGKES